MLGDYADSLPFSSLELQKFAGPSSDLAKLVNKRFVTAAEPKLTVRLDEAKIKMLTGRDPITARFMYREWFTFSTVAKFWISANSKPTALDESDGFWSRIHLIPFMVSFMGREDMTLKDCLKLEFAGILARAVRGCVE